MFRLGAAAVVCLAAILAIFAWSTLIPYKSYDTRAFLEQKGFNKVRPDAAMGRMITRAKLDYLLSPTPTGRDMLKFVQAKRNDNLLYLFFKPARWSNTAVVYAYDAATREALWKTEVGTDDD